MSKHQLRAFQLSVVAVLIVGYAQDTILLEVQDALAAVELISFTSILLALTSLAA